MTTVVFINGPKRVGKDTLAKHLAKRFQGIVRPLAYELKVRTHRLYDCPQASWQDPDYYDRVKDQPNPHFHGISPREAYNVTAEVHLKPLHGRDFFGRLLANWLSNLGGWPPMLVVPDLGFPEEPGPILALPGMRPLLIHVSGGRRVPAFVNDTRSPVSIHGVPAFDALNDVEGETFRFLRAAEGWVASNIQA